METLDYLKQRARAVFASLNRLPGKPTLSHYLNAIARAEGHSNYQSLHAKAQERMAMPFCPHCGAFGTMKAIGTVFCEQGTFRNGSYDYEGDAGHYACERCRGQCANWESDFGSTSGASDDSLVAIVFIKPQPDGMPVTWWAQVYRCCEVLKQFGYDDASQLERAVEESGGDLLRSYHSTHKYELASVRNWKGANAGEVFQSLRAWVPTQSERCRIFVENDYGALKHVGDVQA